MRKDIRELRDFYEMPAGSLWITFAHGHLYWCQADQEVIPIENAPVDQPTRFR